MHPGDGGLSLTWLGHSTVVIDLAGQRLLTDPLLLRHNGPLRRRGPPPHPSQWAGVDAVLLSHLHHDHAELRSLRLVPDVPVVTSERNGRWLATKGLKAAGRGRLDGRRDPPGAPGPGGAPRPAHAAPPQRRPRPPRTVGVDHAVGGRRHQPVPRDGRAPPQAGVERLDVVLVPIGGWGPRLSANHMGPAQAAEACALTGARYALPVHWGTLHAPLMTWMSDWFERPLDAFEADVAAAAPECRVIRLALGETWSCPAGGSR